MCVCVLGWGGVGGVGLVIYNHIKTSARVCVTVVETSQ